jgi:hypothetical protein
MRLLTSAGNLMVHQRDQTVTDDRDDGCFWVWLCAHTVFQELSPP